MTDDGFRSYRRDAASRDADRANRTSVNDPLAELARLIGQSDSLDSRPPVAGAPNEFAEPAPGELDWAASGNYAEEGSGADGRDGRVRSAEAYQSPASEVVSWSDETDTARDAAADARFTWQSSVDRGDADHQQAPLQPPPLNGGGVAFPSLAPDFGQSDSGDQYHQHGEQALGAEGDYAAEEDAEDQYPSRRNWVVTGLGVVGLVVLGSAGALGYHTMFGGSLLSGLPPIIRPAQGPIKIVPNQATAQAGTPSAGTGTSKVEERLVSHEEQPVQLPPPTPRVVTTIPVISGTSSPLPGTPGAAPSSPNLSVAAPVPTPSPPKPGSPAGQNPLLQGAKEVHTVIIRPNQATELSRATPATPPPAVVHAPKPERAHEAAAKPRREPEIRRRPEPRVASAGPLSIVPSDDRAQPPRARAVARRAPERPLPLASATQTPARQVRGGRSAGEVRAGRGTGEYAVQVSSRRSEAEAQASFRALQSRFPQELGGRHATVRRADLGSKGVYYRAMVGPFASADEAAALCKRLRAAGGSCIIQRD